LHITALLGINTGGICIGKEGRIAGEKNWLIVKSLKRYFSLGKGQLLKAIDDVSLDICEGEAFGRLAVEAAQNAYGKTNQGKKRKEGGRIA
jgi:hypothetical protein